MKAIKLLTPVFVFLLLFTNFSYSQSGWQSLNPTPSRFGYQDIKMLNSNTGIAFGRDNIIVRTTDAGETWVPKNSGIPVISGNQIILEHISFINSQTGFIAGNYIIKTTDAGETWAVVPGSELQIYFENIKYTSLNRGYSYTYGFYRTMDGGSMWIQNPIPTQSTGNVNFKGYMDFINDNTGFLAGNNGIIIKTINGGDNWTRVLDTNSQNKFNQIKFINDNVGIAITESGNVFKSLNGGNSWTPLSTFTTSFYYGASVSIFSENDFMMAANQSNGLKFYKTNNGGINWVEFFTPGVYGGSRFDLASGGSLVQCTDRGLIFKSVNNADSWQCKTSKIGYIGDISCVKFLNANTGFMGCAEGIILKTTDSGLNFDKINLNDVNNVTAVSFINDNTGFCTTWKSVYKTINCGSNWSIVSNIDTVEYTNIKFFNEQEGLATAYTDFGESGIYKTQDGGITWTLKKSGAYFKGFNFINEQTGFTSYSYVQTFPHGGSVDHTRFYKTTDKGNTWQYLTDVSANVSAIGFINELTGFASSPTFSLLKTTDGGLNWGATDYYCYANKIQFVNSLTGFIGGKFKTTNGGETWFQQNFEGTTFDYVNSDLGFGAGYGGFIWKTTDGGGSVGINGNTAEVADKYLLSQNYPNPFNPETKIQFSIPKNGLVKIIVYDLLGREVKQLVNEFKQQGTYNVSFNGGNLSSGIYFYKLITDDFIETKKMILVK